MSAHQISSTPEYEKIVATANASPQKLLVLMFTASWCPACKNITPTFEALAKQFPRVLFCKVDVDAAQELATQFKITGMPTFVFLFKNAEKTRMAGANPQTLTAAVEKYSKETSVFSSGGYSLSSGGSSAPAVNKPAAAPSAANKPVAASSNPAPPQKRVNPWADPNWKPPTMAAAPSQPQVQAQTQPAAAQHSRPNPSALVANNGVAPQVPSQPQSQPAAHSGASYKPEILAV